MSKETVLRAASAEDVGGLAELGEATFVETFGHLYAAEDLRAFLSEARSPAVFAALVEDPDMLVALVEVGDGGPVGYVVAGPCKLPAPDLEPRAGEVRELYLLASHQGRGLGSQLLEAALDWLDHEGRTPLYIGVWSENLGAQRLYGRYGFEKIGEYDFPVGRQLDREFILKRRG